MSSEPMRTTVILTKGEIVVSARHGTNTLTTDRSTVRASLREAILAAEFARAEKVARKLAGGS